MTGYRYETLSLAALVLLGAFLLLSGMLNRIYRRRVLGIGPVQRAFIAAAGAVAIVLFDRRGVGEGVAHIIAFARSVSEQLTEWMAFDY